MKNSPNISITFFFKKDNATGTGSNKKALCRIPLLILLLCLIFLFAACSGNSRQVKGAVWFSDVHFTPFEDPVIMTQLVSENADQWDAILAASTPNNTLPASGHESNRALLESVLTDMKQRSTSPDFIIYTGDFLAHRFNNTYKTLTGDDSTEGLQRFIDKTLTYIASRITYYYPATPVYFCLGNNDTYEDDYQITPGGQFLANSAIIFSNAFLKTNADKNLFAATYPTSGHYQLFPGGNNGLRLLALNAVYLSQNASAAADAPATAQLDWLEAALADAARTGDKVWVILHIPPGVDVFATLRANANPPILDQVIPLIKEKHLSRFRSILASYSSTVRTIFAGHIHRDDFRLITSLDMVEHAAVPVLVSPAISPVYGNQSGYKIFNYDQRDYSILDYEACYLDFGDKIWKIGHLFHHAYNFDSLTVDNMASLYESLKINIYMRNQYIRAYDGFKISDSQITDAIFPYYLLGIKYLDSESYRRAVENYFLLGQDTIPFRPLAEFSRLYKMYEQKTAATG
jgi:sphingomyelin phosphodiesterase acid-like 3